MKGTSSLYDEQSSTYDKDKVFADKTSKMLEL